MQRNIVGLYVFLFFKYYHKLSPIIFSQLQLYKLQKSKKCLLGYCKFGSKHYIGNSV